MEVPFKLAFSCRKSTFLIDTHSKQNLTNHDHVRVSRLERCFIEILGRGTSPDIPEDGGNLQNKKAFDS